MSSGTENLETTLRLLRAQQLARRGRVREAMTALAPGGVAPDPLSLQAMAALATAVGDYRMALPLWRQLLERDPANAEARRMIYLIEVWQRRPQWMRWVWPLVGVAVAAALAVVLLTL